MEQGYEVIFFVDPLDEYMMQVRPSKMAQKGTKHARPAADLRSTLLM